MKKIYSVFLLLNLFIFQDLKAQDAPVKISYQVKPDKSVEFDYTKTDPGSYTLVITFKNLTNCFEQPVQKRTIKHYSGRVLGLKPSDANQGIGFSYS